jgi:hypothetical protein
MLHILLLFQGYILKGTCHALKKRIMLHIGVGKKVWSATSTVSTIESLFQIGPMEKANPMS